MCLLQVVAALLKTVTEYEGFLYHLAHSWQEKTVALLFFVACRLEMTFVFILCESTLSGTCQIKIPHTYIIFYHYLEKKISDKIYDCKINFSLIDLENNAGVLACFITRPALTVHELVTSAFYHIV